MKIKLCLLNFNLFKKYLVANVRTISLFLGLLMVNVCYADLSLGEVSDGVLGMASGLGAVVNLMCYVGGTALLIGGISRYRDHRNNPQQVRLSAALVLLITGVALLILPFLASFSVASGLFE